MTSVWCLIHIVRYSYSSSLARCVSLRIKNSTANAIVIAIILTTKPTTLHLFPLAVSRIHLINQTFLSVKRMAK